MNTGEPPLIINQLRHGPASQCNLRSKRLRIIAVRAPPIRPALPDP